MDNLRLYKGQKVFLVRPAAPGDPGYSPTATNMLLLRYEEPGDETTKPAFLAPASEVTAR